MAVPDLVDEVLKANCALAALGLAPLTWGNASGIDRERRADRDQAERRRL